MITTQLPCVTPAHSSLGGLGARLPPPLTPAGGFTAASRVLVVIRESLCVSRRLRLNRVPIFLSFLSQLLFLSFPFHVLFSFPSLKIFIIQKHIFDVLVHIFLCSFITQDFLWNNILITSKAFCVICFYSVKTIFHFEYNSIHIFIVSTFKEACNRFILCFLIKFILISSLTHEFSAHLHYNRINIYIFLPYEAYLSACERKFVSLKIPDHIFLPYLFLFFLHFLHCFDCMDHLFFLISHINIRLSFTFAFVIPSNLCSCVSSRSPPVWQTLPLSMYISCFHLGIHYNF